MTENPVLSICIPTFNRAEYLRTCLESINKEAHLVGFEVVISDNASTDQTIGVIEEFQHRLPIRWKRQAENLGADSNFNAVVELAQGKYCWLLGSDDALVDGAISQILRHLKGSEVEILQFGYIQSTLELKHLRSEMPPEVMIKADLDAMKQHFSSLPNLSLMFTFISAFIFRRSAWIKRKEIVSAWIGSNYVQTAVMHSILVSGGSLKSVKNSFVIARGDNPNEFNTVPGKFLELDAITVSRLAAEIHFDRNDIWVAFGKCFRRSYPTKALVYICAQGGVSYVIRIKPILEKLGYPKFVIWLLEIANKINLFPVFRSAILLRRYIKNAIAKRFTL